MMAVGVIKRARMKSYNLFFCSINSAVLTIYKSDSKLGFQILSWISALMLCRFTLSRDPFSYHVSSDMFVALLFSSKFIFELNLFYSMN